MLFRRRDDRLERAALLRLTRDGEPLFEGEIRPGHDVELPDGLRLQVLWIRKHTTPAPRQ